MVTQLEIAVAKLAGIERTATMLRAQMAGAVSFLGNLDIGSLDECTGVEEQFDLIAEILGDGDNLVQELLVAVSRMKQRNGFGKSETS